MALTIQVNATTKLKTAHQSSKTTESSRVDDSCTMIITPDWELQTRIY